MELIEYEILMSICTTIFESELSDGLLKINVIISLTLMKITSYYVLNALDNHEPKCSKCGGKVHRMWVMLAD